MLVKATKKMATALKKGLKSDNRFINYSIEFLKVSDRFYYLNCASRWDDHENDFDYINNTYNVIKITYPDNYYACDRYITTNDLLKVFRGSDKTLAGFIDNFKDYIEI